jgi:hypothetical protein
MTSHYSDTPLPSLHAVVSGFGGDLQEGEAVWRFEQLTRLLKEGADPNESDEHDVTPLAILMDEHVDMNGPQGVLAGDIVATLIQSGANPLTNDRPIGKSDGSRLGMIMVEEVIAASAKGRVIEDEDGGNLLHVLAEDDLDLLERVLRRKTYPAGGVDTFELPSAWLLQPRQSDGDTPAHALLSDNSIIVSYVENEMDADEYFPLAWECLRSYVTLGVDLKTKNGDGISIANFITDKVNAGPVFCHSRNPAKEHT